MHNNIARRITPTLSSPRKGQDRKNARAANRKWKRGSLMQHQINCLPTTASRPVKQKKRQHKNKKQRIRTTNGIRQGTLFISTPNMPRPRHLPDSPAKTGHFFCFFPVSVKCSLSSRIPRSLSSSSLTRSFLSHPCPILDSCKNVIMLSRHVPWLACLLARLSKKGGGKKKSNSKCCRNSSSIHSYSEHFLSLKSTLSSSFSIHIVYFRITAPLPPQWGPECDARHASLVACVGCC